MKPAMYIFINKGLGMTPGKIAAQAGHAAVEAALLSNPDTSTAPIHYPNSMFASARELRPLWEAWRRGGHYAKYVMEARDGEHMRDIESYLRARGFRTALILDEGHTEVPAISPTALGVALVDKDDPHTEATFSSFKLYREKTYEEGSYGRGAPKLLRWRAMTSCLSRLSALGGGSSSGNARSSLSRMRPQRDRPLR